MMNVIGMTAIGFLMCIAIAKIVDIISNAFLMKDK